MFKIPTELMLSPGMGWKIVHSKFFVFFSFNSCPLIPIECIFFCFCDLYLLIIRDTNGNYTSKLLVLGKKRFVHFHEVS